MEASFRAQEADALAQLGTLGEAVARASQAAATLRAKALARRGQSLLYDALVPQVRVRVRSFPLSCPCVPCGPCVRRPRLCVCERVFLRL